MEIKSRIFFANEKLKKNFEKLKSGKSEEKELYNSLIQAFENLKRNAHYGIQIPKKRIPKEYLKKYGIDNLWKH